MRSSKSKTYSRQIGLAHPLTWVEGMDTAIKMAQTEHAVKVKGTASGDINTWMTHNQYIL